MFCRAAWQRLAPLARKALPPLSCKAVVPVRQMSFGLPASGTNIVYMALGGGSLTIAAVYAYRTLSNDSARNNESVAQIQAKSEDGAVAEVAAVVAADADVQTAANEASTIVEATVAEAVSVVEEEVASEPVEVEAEPIIVQAVEAEAEPLITPAAAAAAVKDIASEERVTETIGEEASVEEAAV
ncbi:hypothetical protein DNTS_013327 [Danionella cerebrum]|uniref:Uncharacterized protein n=1 Tax=Danionella cerebrum TaxID=2873325 RepID=A0A553QGA0_9TELE|nr:hypothetical protein DNTS_013327 [Danionella translucida]